MEKEEAERTPAADPKGSDSRLPEVVKAMTPQDVPILTPGLPQGIKDEPQEEINTQTDITDNFQSP